MRIRSTFLPLSIRQKSSSLPVHQVPILHFPFIITGCLPVFRASLSRTPCGLSSMAHGRISHLHCESSQSNSFEMSFTLLNWFNIDLCWWTDFLTFTCYSGDAFPRWVGVRCRCKCKRMFSEIPKRIIVVSIIPGWWWILPFINADIAGVAALSNSGD